MNNWELWPEEYEQHVSDLKQHLRQALLDRRRYTVTDDGIVDWGPEDPTATATRAVLAPHGEEGVRRRQETAQAEARGRCVQVTGIKKGYVLNG
jgi:hypothetical protein